VDRVREEARRGESVEDLKAGCRPIEYTGIPPGGRGSHPVYGSIHGDNFAISEDGETWVSFHGGGRKGKAATSSS